MGATSSKRSGSRATDGYILFVEALCKEVEAWPPWKRGATVFVASSKDILKFIEASPEEAPKQSRPKGS